MPLPKGFGWSVDARGQRNQDHRENMPYRGAFLTKVLAPADNERVQIDGHLGRKTISYAYPFVSTNAWIRGQPETATTMLSILGSDTNDLQPIGYYDPAKSGAATRYDAVANELRVAPTSAVPKILPYRSITPGDLDMGSNFAHQFLGLQDVYQARGGLSHFAMTSQKAVVESPQFEVHGPGHRTAAFLNDEIRFGTVRRVTATSGSATAPSLVRSSQLSSRSPTKFAFAKEHALTIGSYGFSPLGGKLVDHRQGNVVEDDGRLARSAQTQQELRARFRWFSLLSETKAEIDQSGNWSLTTSGDGFDGGSVDIPAGRFGLKVGQNVDMQSNLDFKINVAAGRFCTSANLGFDVYTRAFGDVSAEAGLAMSSIGIVNINSNVPAGGIQFGGGILPMYPVLIANPTYISTLTGYLGAETTFAGSAGAYAAAASGAWAALSGVAAILDPTMTLAMLCGAAGSAAAAMIPAATAVTAAVGAHVPTISPNPAGFQSLKTISE